jgi:hypothetical protein
VLVKRQKNSLAAPIPVVASFALGGSPFQFAQESEGMARASMPTEQSPEERAGVLRARVQSAIADAGDEGASMTALESVVKARAVDVREAARALAESDESPVETRPGKGGHPRYFLPAEHRPQWDGS